MLAPRQFVVIPVHHEKHVEYANKVCDALTELGMRATVDSRNEKLGYRVREAQLQKVTYQIVVGDGEQENNTVTIRQSGKKESVTLSLDEALAKFKQVYAKHNLDHTAPYEDILTLLKRLQQQNIKLGICTNKHDEAAKNIVKLLFGEGIFSEIIGDKAGLKRKPRPRQSLDDCPKLAIKTSRNSLSWRL